VLVSLSPLSLSLFSLSLSSLSLFSLFSLALSLSRSPSSLSSLSRSSLSLARSRSRARSLSLARSRSLSLSLSLSPSWVEQAMRPSPLYARAGGDGVRSPHRFLLPCDSLQLKTRKLLDARVQRLRRPGTLHARVLQQPPHPCLLPLAKPLSSSCTACSSWKRLVLCRRPFDNTQADTSAPSACARAHT